MGLFGKIRDMLTYEDESDDLEPVKKEVSTVSIPAPVQEEVDFKIEEKEDVKEEVKREVKKEEKTPFTIFTDSDFNDFSSKKEEKKPYQSKEEVHKFKPSPIISPVYGIISGDVKKEENVSVFTRSQDVSVDDVRKKAYGTLEDDLETNLFSTRELVLENNTRNDIFDELNDAIKERDSKGKLDDDSDKIINENDLFSLIDSMYERKDD